MLTVLPEFTLVLGFLFCIGQPPRHRVFAALLGISLCAASGAVAVGAGDFDAQDGEVAALDTVGFQPCPGTGWTQNLGRPIPTPCRNVLCDARADGAGTITRDDFVCLDGCLTLLQESAQRPDCCAFLNASTLLEVLWEHLYPCGPAPVALSLEGLVPATERVASPGTEWFSLDGGQCSLPITGAMWNELCRHTPLSSLSPLPSKLKKPERFRAWTDKGVMPCFPADASPVCLTSDGSFAPESGNAGWGVVVSAVTGDHPTVPGRFINAYFGRTSDIWDLGLPDVGPANAFASELVGLYWAALMCFQLRVPCDVLFRCDNQAALGIASGQATGGDHAICRACQGLHFGLRFWLQPSPSYAHVYGHSGDPANELADALASWGEVHPPPLAFNLNPQDWFRARGAPFDWVPHFCWMHRQPWAAPAMSHGMLTWDSQEPVAKIPLKEQIAPFMRTLPEPEVSSGTGTQALPLVLATYNTLSIVDPGQAQGSCQDGLHGMVGRVALLDKSLAAQNVFLAGLQETRTPAGTAQSAHYKRYCSGCLEKRALGVELWIGVGPDWPEHSAVVLHKDNTRILARMSVLGAHWCVFVGHAPHRGHGSALRKQWWLETTRLCDRTGYDSLWLFCVDGNCGLGAHCSEAVGGLHADAEDEAGELFHQLLRRCNAWVPATFDDFFTGPGGTLVQRRSGQLARSDYLAVPLSWKDMGVWSCVDARISAGHSIPDHYAVLVGLSYRAARLPARKKHGRIDAHALLAPANEHRVLEVLQCIPQVDWQTNVNDHAAVLVDSVYSRLQAMFPLKARRMSKGYLTQETALTHQCLANLRHALRWRCHALRLTFIRCAFLAWRGQGGFSSLFQGKWLHSLRCSIAAASLKLQVLGKQVRRQCRQDRNAYLSGLAEQANSPDPGQAHVAVRKLLRPRKFRGQGPQPLPTLRTPSGELCETPEEVSAEWRRHFASLEGGAVIAPEALLSECLDRQQTWGIVEFIEPSELPSFGELVRALRAVQPHKAAGPDLIPPALCRKFALPLAGYLWPVLLKSALLGSEPMGFKGGTLHHIPKGSTADRDLASSQRGILVQPVFGKVLHKAFRRLPADLFEARAAPHQIGGRRGMSYAFGHFLSHQFLAFAKNRCISAAVIFSDLAAAYYAVVREAVVGARLCNDPIEEVSRSLGLTGEDLQELQAHILSGPVFDASCSELLRAFIRETHVDTWFHIAADGEVVRTRRGTRPGSCIADVAFNLLFEKVLGRRGQFDSSVVPAIPWSGPKELALLTVTDEGAVPRVTLQDIAYADDHAACVVSAEARRLSGAVRHVMGRTLDSVGGHGLTANFGPKKTAALLAHRGAGSRAARNEVFHRSKGKILVLREHKAPVAVDAVPNYKHLGSVISFDGSLLPEVKQKVALAKVAFGEGRRKLFACPHIALRKRVCLCHVHVISALLAGAGAWPLLCNTAWNLLERCITSLCRQMLRIPAHADQHWSRAAVLDACEFPSALDLLAAERLRFLGQLVRKGPSAAWALIQHCPDTVAAYTIAGDWLLAAVSGTCPFPGFLPNWNDWFHVMDTRPRYWKGLIKRATAWHQGRRRAWVMFDRTIRAVWRPVEDPFRAPDHEDHACLLCVKRPLPLHNLGPPMHSCSMVTVRCTFG